ncbi:hypothetical protein L226DRAFT_470105 [Lentinus tigrinus ALCF2SS1-7]|uniref:Uncharacterized protein n=1 Tax=Lentinus tigrinus ALCF2SS1-6 TaxID=1328759 RepID=A0A5C2S4S4_9APHY|nr:hypothetical protein L227DRAFT_506009 [Lentinus tigrinus ALCF2SS1-6]RPD70396.1 hypothetical protein L226DRAFT_470105 [Lentinus tigrinus ALCF2SS1-7]
MFRGLVPLPSHYAVIRTDPEAMLKDLGLDDPETLAEAKDMSRKKYLVFLEWPEELPMPGMRWCRYDVCPIGTTLRPPDESRGITSDMVVPIAPNKGHTPDRHPVHTTPSFPFSNCYHWIFNSVSVRVRVHEDGVEHDGAIRLSPKEHNTMNDTFFPDAQRVGTFLHEKYGASSATEEKKPEQVAAASACDDDAHGTGLPVEASAQDGDPTHVLSDIYRRLVTQRGLRKSGPPSHGDDKSQPRLSSSSKDASGSHDAQKQSTITPVTSRDSGIDLFGWDPDPNTARIPLVDAWLDIDKHFTEDDITSPVELKKEFEQIDA